MPNPSFETYTMCPNNTGQISNATGWMAAISTPDYFNICSTNTNLAVPINLYGCNYQNPHFGNAYSGIQTLVLSFPNSRENISVQLSSILTLDNYYLVKFYINKVNCIQYAHNNIALNFSNVLTTTVSAGSTVNLPMHIYKFGNPIIADTLNWTEIMGIYKANGTEQYITIGNFKDDTNTQVLLANPTNSSTASYYLLDDVSVEPICTPFWSYRDTTVAIGDSVLIGPAITGLNINWYDATGTFITNAPGIYVKPNSPTFYTATEDFCGSVITHTINVGVSPVGIKDVSYWIDVVGVYPNPNNGDFKVELRSNVDDETPVIINIMDVVGKTVYTQSTSVKESTIDVKQNLPVGVYIIMLIQNEKTIGVSKLVIK